MIVVVGLPLLEVADGDPRPAGTAAAVAAAAVAEGSPVQLVGKVGEDPDGDALVLALARAAIGHVAVLRDPSRRTPRLLTDGGGPATAAWPVAEHDHEAPARIEPADERQRPALDAADIDLGLRYVTDYAVIVAIAPLPEDGWISVARAAEWASAALVALVPPGTPPPAGLPDDATVIEMPETVTDAGFTGLVARFAAALDRGEPPAQAFAAARDSAASQPVRD